jgi:hypothetical protein
MDENNNLPVAVDGNQAIIGTDVYSSAGQTAHAQVMKVAWGNDATVTRATTTTPLPVQVYGLTGTLSTVTVTGSVKGLGVFTVGNTSGSPVYVTGGVNAFIYGVTGAPPVAVTGGVSILGNVGITGTVNVTGGRYLTQTTDSITVGGTLARSWNLSNATDNIKVYGSDGGLTLPVKIIGADGTPIGNSGGALNVNLVNAGLSASVTFSGIISVINSSGTVLRVEGTANGTPVPISGAVSFVDGAEITIANNPLAIDVLPSGLTFAGDPQFPAIAKNIEKLLTNYENDSAYSIPWYLKEIREEVGWAGASGSVAKRLNELVTDGSTNRQTTFTGVRTFNSTRNEIKTWTVSLNGTTYALLDPAGKSSQIKHGVTIKNISTETILIGAGIYVPSNPTDWSAPATNDQIGIYLAPQESIFIPNSIYVTSSISSPPPLYGKVQSTAVTTNISALAIMAV